MIAFLFIEANVADPMFRLPLFKIRAFSSGTLATFLAAIGRGGLMFMLIIWLQGIWLPEHGYSFARTPLWAGILMLPLTLGFLLAGPISGYLSDQFGARYLATGGMVAAAISFVLMMLLPVNFNYLAFALILLLVRDVDGRFRVTESSGDNEQPARARPWGGRWHERDVPEFGPGAVDRHLLHA